MNLPHFRQFTLRRGALNKPATGSGKESHSLFFRSCKVRMSQPPPHYLPEPILAIINESARDLWAGERLKRTTGNTRSTGKNKGI
jgi:hypothetical protein